MFGLFKSGKNNKSSKKADKKAAAKSAALRENLRKQIAAKRAEMGPEALEKLQQALRIQQAKKKVQSMVDQDDRRAEVVRKIRTMREDDH